jgi:signal transduction histidine kinase
MEDLLSAETNESIPRACVILTITDTGKGISSDFIRSKLFTPFAQENSLSSGTGLGLSIVRSIVALLEGEIAIKSELGRGTGMLFLYGNLVYPALRNTRQSCYTLSRVH